MADNVGFTGTVGADDAVDAALFHRHVQTVQGLKAVEGLDDISDLLDEF
jgi:hypothetical protein